MMNDRIFVSTSFMEGSAEVAWAAASSGILSPNDRDEFSGELLIHMDGQANIKWWDGDNPYVLVIDPERRNGSYVTVYASEDQPPDESAEIVWSSHDHG